MAMKTLANEAPLERMYDVDGISSHSGRADGALQPEQEAMCRLLAKAVCRLAHQPLSSAELQLLK